MKHTYKVAKRYHIETIPQAPKGSVVAAPGEISRGPFVQTLQIPCNRTWRL
jgi:hypothetical protein